MRAFRPGAAFLGSGNMNDANKPISFSEVLDDELKFIQKRRKTLSAGCVEFLAAIDPDTLKETGNEPAAVAKAQKKWAAKNAALGEACPRKNLVGLALSGGGIRSATFCLGFLQGLHRFKLLPMFDYLSTVSGGGFVGGCWNAWLARMEFYLDLSNINLPKDLHLAKFKSLEFDLPNNRLCCHGQFLTEIERNEVIGIFARAVEDAKKDDKPSQHEQLSLDKVKEFFARIAAERQPRDAEKVFPPLERIELEPDRLSRYLGTAQTDMESPSVGESGMSAGDDPIHHIRLFSNYLTPRKGLLSTDAWRAATVVMRNMVMNWLIVIPILFTAIAIPRIYFAFQPQWAFSFRQTDKAHIPSVLNPDGKGTHYPDGYPVYLLTKELQEIARINSSGRVNKVSDAESENKRRLEADYLNVLKGRAVFGAIPLSIVLSWVVILSIAWMSCVGEKRTSRDWAMGLGTFCAGFLLIACLIWFLSEPLARYITPLQRIGSDPNKIQTIKKSPVIWALLALCPALFMIGWAIWPLYSPGNPGYLRSEVRQNRILRLQTALMIIFVIMFVALLASGFAYEMFAYVWTVYGGPYVRAAGIFSVLGTVGATGFTAWKAAPSGGGDHRQTQVEPGAASRIIFWITPVLVWILLLVVGEAMLHAFLRYVDMKAYQGSRVKLPLPPIFKLTAAAGIGLMMCVLLAASEMSWKTNEVPNLPRRTMTILLILCLLFFEYVHFAFKHHDPNDPNWDNHPLIAMISVIAVGSLVVLHWC